MPKALLNVSGMDENGEPYSYEAGDDVPANHAKAISNPLVFKEDPEDLPVPERKAGLEKWREYAESKGIDTEDKDKDQIVAEVQSRNLLG